MASDMELIGEWRKYRLDLLGNRLVLAFGGVDGRRSVGIGRWKGLAGEARGMRTGGNKIIKGEIDWRRLVENVCMK